MGKANERYGMVGAAFVLLTMIGSLLAGCSERFSPEALPPMAPSPSSTHGDSQMQRAYARYIFVALWAEQMGGMPTSLECTYICSDGTVQHTLERTDDTVVILREGQADTAQILESAASLKLPEPTLEVTEPVTSPPVLTEYAGPSLSIEIASQDGGLKTWVGSPRDVPDPIRTLVNAARRVGQSMPRQTLSEGQPLIRSHALPLGHMEPAQRAALVVEVDSERLATAPFIQTAITYSRRLVPIPSEQSLYGTIPLSFTHQRSAYLAYNGQVFQIRHLLAEVSCKYLGRGGVLP